VMDEVDLYCATSLSLSYRRGYLIDRYTTSHAVMKLSVGGFSKKLSMISA
jgi:hypothetical protein